MSRIWSIKMNLDEFNALLASAFSDSEKIAMLSGLSLGLNGGTLPEGCSNGVRTAFEAGSSWRGKTVEFVESQKEAGRKSAESRKQKFGSSQPKVVREIPNTVRTALDESSNLTNNQITNISTSTVPAPSSPKKSRKKDEIPPIPEELVPVAEFLVSNWPATSYGYSDSDKRSVEIYCLADLWSRVWNVAKATQKVPGAILFCGVPYVRRIMKDSQDTGKARFVKDMSNFWGIKADNRFWEGTYSQGLSDYNEYMEKSK